MSSDFLDKDIVYVSSANRDSGDSDDFTINLTTQIRTPNDYDTVSLLNFSCPKSYYLINSLNNTFTVNENGNITTITITPGNYTLIGPLDVFSTVLTNALSSCLWDYAITTNTSTGKYEFDVTGNGGIQPIFNFSGNSPYQILGFEKTSYTFTANSLTSVNIVNFQLVNNIKLCCNFVDKGILSIIVPNTSDFSNISYAEYNANFASHRLTTNSLGNAKFWIVEGNTGNPIDLNGLNFSFTFVIYKKNSYYQHMLEDRKLELQLMEVQQKLLDLDMRKNKKDNN
jgi:hypothetical protein